METTATPSLLPHLWKATLATGVLAVILGVLVFVRPGAAIIVTAIFFGAYLLVTGIWQVVLALSLRSPAGSRILLFVSGAASLVLAVLCFVNLDNSIQLLAIWIGVGFIFRGVATAMSAIGDQSLPGRIWEIIVGVISIIAGIIMFVAPVEGLVALTQVTGIILIVLGIVEVISAFGIRSDAKKLKAAFAPEPPTVT
ncbi:HdeD family acid-resistance protein [Mycolicibacterium brisbanense]|uniref:Integral membrane protein n=1 Tax=Mycolicibacterium brisbanense TaxID=146020 RepID=A0A100VXL3_9MYCO|nr:HdeD family acid-resistance protein [Mycolicibacterium brisbanense]MCV7161263.1 HdeD family acid-resistance protein [Mycolicibacterium brisbanense]GAS87824.1 integral membrane protein [Mycolicibacterium brisbanense]